MPLSRTPLPLAAATLAAGLAAGPALAADLLPPLPALDGPAAAAPVGAGWYLRGDIGYSAYRDIEATARAGGTSAALSGESLDAAFTGGLGAGYRFNSWLRTDVTVDHRFSERAVLFADVPSGGARGTAELASTAALLNGYLDLGTWHGFTPYVGAGVGYAWNHLSGYATGGCAAPCALNGIALTAGIAEEATTTGDFAWALMGGVSVALGRSLSLDMGYRYIDLGEASLDTAAGTTIDTDSLAAHEARIGVRWTFGAPAPSAGPLSRSF